MADKMGALFYADELVSIPALCPPWRQPTSRHHLGPEFDRLSIVIPVGAVGVAQLLALPSCCTEQEPQVPFLSIPWCGMAVWSDVCQRHPGCSPATIPEVDRRGARTIDPEAQSGPYTNVTTAPLTKA
jgi:hypothetical protein